MNNIYFLMYTHNRCLCLQTSEKWISQVYETSSYKTTQYFRNKNGTIKLMFTFYLYLAFIQTISLINIRFSYSPLIYLTLKYNIGWLFL